MESVSGILHDPSGTPVPKATVTLFERGTHDSAATEESGRYLLRSVLPGTYRIEVRANGFEKYEQGRVVIEVNAEISSDAVLRIASRRETAQVETHNPLPHAADSKVELLGRQSINDLHAKLQIRAEAFNGRNRTQFAGPDTRVGDATFGKITAQANQPRQCSWGSSFTFDAVCRLD